MRRISTLSVLFLAAGVLSACSLPDEVITTENIPTAGVRFINAVPDTNLVDMRFVDRVESNAHFRIGFRANPVTAGGVPASTQVQYKNARAGSRHFRVFLDDTLQAIASQVLKDTTYTFEAGKNYTVMMWGNARSAAADKMRFDIWEEAVPDPAASVSLRLINATSTALDAYQFISTGAPAASADFANVAAYTRSNYVNTTPTSGTSTTTRYRVTTAGAANTTRLFPDASALPGGLATSDIEPLPGTRVAGSAITGIVFPGSVVGSKGVQFATTTGSTRQGATITGYVAPRSYISDGFVVGAPVVAAGFSTAANNGASVVAAVTDGATTGSRPASADTVTFLNNVLSATAGGYARTTGSFVTDGFAVGQIVTAAGFSASANNGESTITAVTATTMTVTKSTAPILEAGTTGSISLAANLAGYVRTAGSFITDGFRVGHQINAKGFAAAAGTTPTNDGVSTVALISGDGLSMAVTKASGLAVEAAAAGRVLTVSATRSIVGFGRLDVTKAGGTAVEAPANATTALPHSVTVTPPPFGITFVWDRRPPRTACSPLC